MPNKIEVVPIGYIISNYKERALTHEEAISTPKGKAIIKILPKYLKGITGLKAGMTITVIFNFHKANGYKLTYTRPFGDTYGVFALHAPDRPNAIGISQVHILEIKEDMIMIDNSDMIDGTPVLDIKLDRN